MTCETRSQSAFTTDTRSYRDSGLNAASKKAWHAERPKYATPLRLLVACFSLVGCDEGADQGLNSVRAWSHHGVVNSPLTPALPPNTNDVLDSHRSTSLDASDHGPGALEDGAKTEDTGPSRDAAEHEGPDAVNDNTDTAPLPSIGRQTRYPSDRVHSPLSEGVVSGLRAAINQAQQRRGGSPRAKNLFMKVGASSLASSSILGCFAGNDVDVANLSDELVSTLDHFLNGDAAGSDPFSRKSLSAKSGRSAGWAISGSPSPFEQELSALSPQFALVEYGTNDMGLGSTYASAMPNFARNLLSLVDQALAAGIIPIVHTNRARHDSASANKWVGTYNAVIRAIAQGRQVPLLDQFQSMVTLPTMGLGSDGLHTGSYYHDGSYRSCWFNDEALNHGTNVRNLSSLEALDRMLQVFVDGADALDAEQPVEARAGSRQDPFVVDALPYSEFQNTEGSPWNDLALYTGCSASADESGPEYVYRLELTETTRIRALVADDDGVDIDLHLLDSTATEEGCLLRHDRLIETTLGPGTYHFALDTYVSGSEAQAGEFIFVIVACEDNDSACN